MRQGQELEYLGDKLNRLIEYRAASPLPYQQTLAYRLNTTLEKEVSFSPNVWDANALFFPLNSQLLTLREFANEIYLNELARELKELNPDVPAFEWQP